MNGSVYDSRAISPTLTTNKGEGIKVAKYGCEFKGYTDVALTVEARDYKGFGKQQMTGVIESNE